MWTWTAICADTNLVPCWLVGDRSFEDARDFIADLALRLSNQIQLTTDGHGATFTPSRKCSARIDYAQLHELYKKGNEARRHALQPGEVCIGIDKRRVIGDPKWEHISTSYVERQNLSMRIGMRRFTRLTNAFSRKVENLAAAVSLHYVHYNFARPHKTLSKPYPKTPAMAASVADHVWTV